MKLFSNISLALVAALFVGGFAANAHAEIKAETKAERADVVAIKDSRGQAGGIYIDVSKGRFEGTISSKTTVKGVEVEAQNSSTAQLGGVVLIKSDVNGSVAEKTTAEKSSVIAVNKSTAMLGGVMVTESKVTGKLIADTSAKKVNVAAGCNSTAQAGGIMIKGR